MTGQLPMITDVDEAIRRYCEADPLDPDDLHTALVRVGRNPAVQLLGELLIAGKVTERAAARVAASVWCGAHDPQGGLDEETWLELFELAGYTVDGVPAARPVQPRRLYRGSVPERRDRMSWTDDREVAERFAAGGLEGRERGVVWTALVEPWRLLCRIHEGGRGEAEYVVDTRWLEITESS